MAKSSKANQKKTTPAKAKKQAKTTALVPVKTEPNEVQNFGDFLSERDELVARFLAGGKKVHEVVALLNIKESEIDKLRSNPTFATFYNDLVTSKGLANKNERLASEKRIADALDEEIMRRLSDPDNTDLEKQSLANLLRMRNESFDKIKGYMGEEQEKQQNTMILIMDRVKKNSGKNVTDPEKFNPADEFPVIDVLSEEIT